MSSVKISTKIQSFQDVQKSLQDIEKYLNKLEKSIQSPAELEVTDKDGKTGDIKTTKNTDGSYTFEIRTIDGWKTPVFQEHPIAFKEKLSSYSKKKLVKSISDIQADDTTKGTSIADKTIFDEKNNKFDVSHLTVAQTGGLMRPDYDSGWVDMTNTDTTGTHDLGSVPILGIWQVSNDSGTTVQFERIHDDDDNSVLNVTSSAWRIYGNGDYGYWANGGASFTAINYTGFKARVLLWK